MPILDLHPRVWSLRAGVNAHSGAPSPSMVTESRRQCPKYLVRRIRFFVSIHIDKMRHLSIMPDGRVIIFMLIFFFLYLEGKSDGRVT